MEGDEKDRGLEGPRGRYIVCAQVGRKASRGGSEGTGTVGWKEEGGTERKGREGGKGQGRRGESVRV